MGFYIDRSLLSSLVCLRVRFLSHDQVCFGTTVTIQSVVVGVSTGVVAVAAAICLHSVAIIVKRNHLSSTACCYVH